MSTEPRSAAVPTKRLSSAPPPHEKKRKKVRKEEIVAAATRLFAERGYEGTSMGDLAQRVGLQKASLFHHFTSKEALYGTVIQQLMGGIKAVILTAAVSEGSFAVRFDALTDALTMTLFAQPFAARLLVREVMDGGLVMKTSMAHTVNDVLASALEFARAGQAEGSFDPLLDAHHTIMSIVGMHLLPFTIGDVVERFTGTSPFDESFLEARRAAIRQQVRRLVLARHGA